MTLNEKLIEISKYLSNEKPYHRIPDVNQYSHFVIGVYIVQAKMNLNFAQKFFKWLDDNDIKGVAMTNIVDGYIYSIVVDKESE